MWWLDQTSAASQWADDSPLDMAAWSWSGQADALAQEPDAESETECAAEEPTPVTAPESHTGGEQLEQLQAQVHQLEEQLTSTQVAGATAAQRHAEGLAAWQTRHADLEQSLAERSAIATQVEARLLEQQAVQAAQQREWQAADAAANARLQELHAAAEAWRARTTQLEGDLDSQRHVAATWQSELAGLQAQFDAAKSDWYTQLQDEQQKLANREAASRALEAAWQEQETAHLGNIAAAQARAAVAEERMVSLEAQVRSLHEQTVALRAEVESSRRAESESAASLADLQAQWQTQIVERDELAWRLQQEQSARQAAEDQSQLRLAELGQTRRDLAQARHDFQARQEQVEIERHDLSVTLAGLTTGLRQSRQQVGDLETALLRQAREIQGRDDQLQTLILAGERSGQRLAALQLEFDAEATARERDRCEADIAAETVAGELAAAQVCRQQLEAQVAQLQQEQETQTSALRALEAEVAARDTAQRQAHAAAAIMAGELDAAQAGCRRLEAQVAQLQLERESQQLALQELNNQCHALRRSATQQTEAAERRVQAVVQESDRLRKSRAESESRLAELISDLRGETIQLSAKIIAAGEEMQRLQRMLEQRERELAADQTQREQAEALAAERLRTSEMLRGQIQALAKGIQREAAARRKIEAALTRKVTEPDCPPQARQLQERLEEQRQIAQLTQQLAAQRNLEQLIRRQAAAEIQRLNNLLAAATDKSAG